MPNFFPKRPFFGSTDWGAQQFLRLLDREDRVKAEINRLETRGWDPDPGFARKIERQNPNPDPGFAKKIERWNPNPDPGFAIQVGNLDPTPDSAMGTMFWPTSCRRTWTADRPSGMRPSGA